MSLILINGKLVDVLDFIHDYYNIDKVPKYNTNKSFNKKENKKLVPKGKKINARPTKEEEISFLTDESYYKNPNVLFSYDWKNPFKGYLKDGEWHVNIPDVYRTSKKNPNMYDNLFDVTKALENAITLNGDTRVKNMLRVNLRLFFNVPLKKITSVLNIAGDFIMPFSPLWGFIVKSPGYVEDAIELVNLPNAANTIELLTNALDIPYVSRLFGLTRPKTLHIPQGRSLPRRSIEVEVPTANGVDSLIIQTLNDAHLVVEGESLIESLSKKSGVVN